MTPKRKSAPKSKDDARVTAIVIGLFIAAVILVFIFSKARESRQETVQPVHEALERSKPQKIIFIEHHPLPVVRTQTPGKIPGTGGKIAFIIDDWGQTMASCKYLKEIPDPVAVSILPGLRHTRDVANYAKQYHKLTMLHLPLQALHNYDIYPKNYIIKTTMKPDLVIKIVDEDMAQLPSIEGVNNHMGSKATGDMVLMRIIFKEIKKKRLFFVDSMTAPDSICTELADEMGLPFGKRDVFLDNIITREAITKQFESLAQKARRRGYAVAIGHAFNHLTMQILKEEIPKLKKQGFEIVSIKDLLRNK